MTFAADLKAGLLGHLGQSWITFLPGWNTQRRVPWPGGTPRALLLHHTAAAATASQNPNFPGNRKGANRNVISYIQTHYEVPAANFTLDRDGTVYIHSAYPVWHAGLGTFTGKAPWSQLRIPKDLGNDYMLGVEIMSKGLTRDFTHAQEESLVFLLRACRQAAGWSNIGLLRRPQHKDWTGRKIDTRYSNAQIGQMIETHGYVQG